MTADQKEQKSDSSDTQLTDDTKQPQRPSSEVKPLPPAISLVIMHPLVLLSIVDHYSRVAKDTNRRVVGILLGETHAGKIDVTNSYAIPFEEDAVDNSAWYIDRQYHEDMFTMFKKINASEKVIGWYSTSDKLKQVDLQITEMLRSYCEQPVLVRVNINPSELNVTEAHRELELPTQAYIAVPVKEGKESANNPTRTVFQHVASEIGAYEAEEVGVEHLLRNLRDVNEQNSLSEIIQGKVHSLRAFKAKLVEINSYLDDVVNGHLPLNHEILGNLQQVLNFIPDLSVQQLIQSFSQLTKDNYTMLYISSLIRSIVALHDLINNKLANKQAELDEGKTEEEKQKERDDRKRQAREKKKKEDEAKEKEAIGKNKSSD